MSVDMLQEKIRKCKNPSVIAEYFMEEMRHKEQEYLKNRLAALRMMRDKSWQQLETQLEGLTDSEKIRRQEQNALLQYKEQRLELLLAAKGFSNCLIVLDEEQANIIVAEQAMENQYEKLYDLILRNSDYPAEQIILIPVAANPI